MTDWPIDLTRRRFHPRDVEKLTDISPEQQRLWAKRYEFDFRTGPLDDAVRPNWEWIGIQRLTAFRDAFVDMKDAGLALTLVNGSAGFPQTLTFYEMDLREHPDGDVLLTWEFGTRQRIGPTTPKGLAHEYSYADRFTYPGRLYVLNLSDVQRRLGERLGGLA